VDHLKGVWHRDDFVRKILPILIASAMMLFPPLILLPNYWMINVLVNAIIVIVMIFSAVYLLLRLRNKKDRKGQLLKVNQTTVEKSILVILLLSSVVYTIVSFVFFANYAEDHYWLNKMISAIMVTGACSLLALYRYRRGSRLANELVKKALSNNNNNTLMGQVWNRGFNVFQLTADGSASNGTPSENIRVFSTIYGFLAGIAITIGLQTYYSQFINPYFLNILNPTSANILVHLRLADFFLIAIPLAHSGYIFLSGLTINSAKFHEYSKSAPSLTAIFVICIVQIAFLFFLGNSIAYNCPAVDSSGSTPDICKQPDTISLNQTKFFVFWLTLTSVLAGLGSLFIRWIIENNRIPIEWVLLHAITFGFLMVAYILLFSNSRQGTQLDASTI
jgi:hypothetical protein